MEEGKGEDWIVEEGNKREEEETGRRKVSLKDPAKNLGCVELTAHVPRRTHKLEGYVPRRGWPNAQHAEAPQRPGLEGIWGGTCSHHQITHD